MILYHNPRCGKSREALKLLNEKGIDPEIRAYLKEPLTQKELKEIVTLLGIEAKELVRTTEAIYKEQYKGKDLTSSQWIKAMTENPKLIQRPILVNGEKAAIGRPAENLLEII